MCLKYVRVCIICSSMQFCLLYEIDWVLIHLIKCYPLIHYATTTLGHFENDIEFKLTANVFIHIFEIRFQFVPLGSFSVTILLWLMLRYLSESKVFHITFELKSCGLNTWMGLVLLPWVACQQAANTTNSFEPNLHFCYLSALFDSSVETNVGTYFSSLHRENLLAH